MCFNTFSRKLRTTIVSYQILITEIIDEFDQLQQFVNVLLFKNFPQHVDVFVWKANALVKICTVYVHIIRIFVLDPEKFIGL